MAASTDVVVFRRVLREARPCWPFIGVLFLLSLLASPLALLTPLPLKIAVDSVIGGRPLPGVVAPLLAGPIARSPVLLRGVLGASRFGCGVPHLLLGGVVARV